jgi:hypothetical protein
MIKFNGTSFLNNVIISNSESTPSVPNVTTEWPASQPLLFDQTQTTDNLWGVANFIATVGDLFESGDSYVDFYVNPISNPGETVPISKAWEFTGNPFTLNVTNSDPDYFEADVMYNGTPVGAEGSWSNETGQWLDLYSAGPSQPAGTPATVHGKRRGLGDVREVWLSVRNDKPAIAALYFTPDENMPQNKTFINNWGPLGFLDIVIESRKTDFNFGQLDGTRPVNLLAGIIKQSAVGTLPSLIAISDIMCGVLVRNNDAIFVQNGVELYRTNTTANPGPANNPGGYVYGEVNPDFWYTPAPPAAQVERYGYDGVSQAITQGDAPNGLSDFTNTLRISSSEVYVPKKNGTHTYPISYGGSLTTKTLTYNATTNTNGSSSIPSGTTAPSQDYEGSDWALVCHNETNLVGITDDGSPLMMDIRLKFLPNYDREGIQCRSY